MYASAILRKEDCGIVVDSVQDLKFDVVYCNLLHDSLAAEDQVLLPFLYQRQDIAWAQQHLGWSLEDMGGQ